MMEYRLSTPQRCAVLASKISGGENNSDLVRKRIRTDLKMEFWKEKFTGKKHQERCLFLLDNKQVIAIARDKKIYFNQGGSLKRIETENINDVLSYLIIKRNWYIQNKSIGHSENGGETFEIDFRLTDEEAVFPLRDNYNIEPIQIV